jgi:hypothetical protein
VSIFDGRFAGAVVAQQADYFALPYGKVDPIDC